MQIVIGVDTIGTQAIAGPLVTAAVAFMRHNNRPVLKRLRREDYALHYTPRLSNEMLRLFDELIKTRCIEYAIVKRAAWEITKEGIQCAQDTSIASAVTRLLERLAMLDMDINGYSVYIHGQKKNTLQTNEVDCPFRYTCVPKIDHAAWHISAATILATVSRNQEMQQLLEIHPSYKPYEWDKNRGFATPNHLNVIDRLGKTKQHR